VKLVIFDMDGVLVDACEWHRVALNEALMSVCGYQISLEDHYGEYNGLPTKVKLLKLLERGIINFSSLEEVEKVKQEKTVEAVLAYAKIRQEKIDLMNFLKSKNVKIACYTNSIRMTAEIMLERTGILSHLDLLVTNQDVAKAKPDPEGYLLCMSKFGVSKDECLIIEDSPKGLQAAFLSGANVLKVEKPDDVTIELLEGKFV